MNEYQMIREILELTKDWHVPEWKSFRSYNDYWELKDQYYAQGKGRYFLRIKLQLLKE